jgi:3'-phosphoadenosine 5'-phosphosulfate (PAPS) 3'-phosphatase
LQAVPDKAPTKVPKSVVSASEVNQNKIIYKRLRKNAPTKVLESAVSASEVN